MITLGFFELEEKEQPDERIWDHPELMREHWEAIKAARRNPGSETIDDSDDDGDYVENELFKEALK